MIPHTTFLRGRLWVAIFALGIPILTVANLRAGNSDSYSVNNWVPVEMQGSIPQDELKNHVDFDQGKILDATGALAILSAVRSTDPTWKLDVTTAYVINLLVIDPSLTKATSNQWYVYDTDETSHSWFWESDQDVIDRRSIADKKYLELIYVRIYPKGVTGATIKNPVSYTVTQSKQDSTPWANVKTLTSIIGGPTAAAANFLSQYETQAVSQNYAIYFDVLHQGRGDVPNAKDTMTAKYVGALTLSSWGFQVAFNQTKGADVKSDAYKAAEAQANAAKGSPTGTKDDTTATTTTANGSGSSTISFIDERKTWWDLSVAVPINSYSQVTVQGTPPNVTPKSSTVQSAYFAMDIYFPWMVQPSLENKRWFPHAFWGLPSKGKVLDQPMFGLASSVYLGEVFGGVIWDRQNTTSTGARSPTVKGVFGLKISLTDFKNLSSSSKTSSNSN